MISTEDRILQHIRNASGVPDVSLDADLSDAMDSLDSVALRNAIEFEFNIVVDDETVGRWTTGRDILATVRGRLA